MKKKNLVIYLFLIAICIFSACSQAVNSEHETSDIETFDILAPEKEITITPSKLLLFLNIKNPQNLLLCMTAAFTVSGAALGDMV